jgi:3-phosphoshikimate 1-carboxyvinyltransferase
MPDRAAQIAALSLPLDQLPDPLPIPTIERPFNVTIRPPGSKSITNRALLLAALADGTSELRGPLIDADDAQVMLRAIQQLGAKAEIIRAGTDTQGGTDGSPASGAANLDIVRITGVNGRWKIPAGHTVTLNLNNAGTATRFLTAAAILAPADSGGIIIDGDARMRQRPIGELVAALHQLGVSVDFLGQAGFPPLRIQPPVSPQSLSGSVSLDRTASSQFISALMMVAPFLPRGLSIRFRDPPSWPYIKMTQAMLEIFGANTNDDHGHAMTVWSGSRHTTEPSGQTGLRAFSTDIEPDASGATYFAAAALLAPHGRVFLKGAMAVDDGGLQGDSRFFDVVSAFGGELDEIDAGVSVLTPGYFSTTGNSPALHPIEFDFDPIPDTAMTAAVLACFATPTSGHPDATSTLHGLRTLRVKETDRLAALQCELTKLGARVELVSRQSPSGPDEALRITTPPLTTLHSPLPPLFFDTYHDHRMAMSLALIGLRRPNVFIRDPKCVAKTYPTFWQDLAKLYS